MKQTKKDLLFAVRSDREHANAPYTCPVCDSGAVSYESSEVEGNISIQPATCDECYSTWVDVYKCCGFSTLYVQREQALRMVSSKDADLVNLIHDAFDLYRQSVAHLNVSGKLPKFNAVGLANGERPDEETIRHLKKIVKKGSPRA